MAGGPVQPQPVNPFDLLNSIDSAIAVAHTKGAFNDLPMSYTVELFGNIQMLTQVLSAAFGQQAPAPEDGEEVEVPAGPTRAQKRKVAERMAKAKVRTKPGGGKKKKR